MGFLLYFGLFQKEKSHPAPLYTVGNQKGAMHLDFLAALQKQFENKGIFPVKAGENQYWRVENPILYLVYLHTEGCVDTQTLTTFSALCQTVLPQLPQFDCTKLVALFISVDMPAGEETVEIVDNFVDTTQDTRLYPVFWQFSTESGKVTAPKGQPDRLLGIEKLLAAAARGEEPQALPLREAHAQKPPFATAAIFLLCLLSLLWTEFFGNAGEIIARFGMSPAALSQGEYYRFLSCMFLHGGWLHLISNSIYLYYFGIRTERLLGTARFLLLYLCSGICGSLCSLSLGASGLSIGASGAIYGLLGAMLLLTKKRGAIYTGMSYTTMLLLAISAICLGFFEPNVDNFAHIGGFLGGILIFGLFLRQKALK